jgi:hypothetical protein
MLYILKSQAENAKLPLFSEFFASSHILIMCPKSFI